MRASTCLSLAVCCTAVIFSSAAFAQSGPIGAGGRLILSADRLFGLNFSTLKTEDEDGDVSKQSRTDVALLFRPVTFSPATIPQIGLDVGVVGGLTVGGALGFYTQSGTNENTPNGGGTTTTNDSPTLTAFVLAPRVGYGIPIVPWLAFWPRLGFSYHSYRTSQTSMGNNPTTRKTTLSGVSLNVDPMFVFVPVQHFGITAGPYLDLPLSGSTSSEVTQNDTTMSSPDEPTKFTEFGLKVGLLGAFL